MEIKVITDFELKRGLFVLPELIRIEQDQDRKARLEVALAAYKLAEEAKIVDGDGDAVSR